MKLRYSVLLSTLFLLVLSGCSAVEEEVNEAAGNELGIAAANDVGAGSLELVTPTITINDNEIQVKAQGIDEEKITSISVANETLYEDYIENDKVYTLNISDVEDAHSPDYDPKVELIHLSDDDFESLDGDITTFKQVRYNVEEE